MSSAAAASAMDAEDISETRDEVSRSPSRTNGADVSSHVDESASVLLEEPMVVDESSSVKVMDADEGKRKSERYVQHCTAEHYTAAL